MLTLHDNNIILGSIGGGGVAPPANGWLAPPAMTETTMNGLTDACGLFCNVLNIGDRNYFSCIAAGNYTVSVYTSVGGTLISSQNIAANAQCNWQIDWADCTHNVDVDTKQAYVEITPQAGQSLTLLRFNANHPAETNANSAPNLVSVYGVLPALTGATGMFASMYVPQSATLSLPALISAASMFQVCFALTSVTFLNLPVLENTTNMFQTCYALQSVTFLNLPAVIDATNMFTGDYALQILILPSLSTVTTVAGMFGTTVENTALRSLRKLLTPGLGTAFPSGRILVLRHTAIQAAEALAWVASLGSSTNTITFDLRNNPFCIAANAADIEDAIYAKFPNATVTLV